MAILRRAYSWLTIVHMYVRELAAERGVLFKTKLLRLTLAGLITAVLCLSYFYLFQPQDLYYTYRCITAVRPWYACYLGRDLEFQTELFGMHYEGNINNLIDVRVLQYGAFEKYQLYLLRDVTLSTGRSRTFLDVGANSGQHSMYMSRYFEQVHAFEPYRPVIETFRKRLEANQITNVIIHPVGLGNENKKLPFFEPPQTNLGIGSFVADWASDNSPHGTVDVVVGDEELKKFNVDFVDLIKIDVEGFELPVLQGLAQTLGRYRPVVVFELSINPRNELSFKSIEHVKATFPDRYTFLVFKSWDEYTGSYELGDMRDIVRFDLPSQYDVVAYPNEITTQIPRKNLPG